MIYERLPEGIILVPADDEPIKMSPQGYMLIVGPDQFAMPVILRSMPIMTEKSLFVQATGISGVPVWETKIPFTEADTQALKSGPMTRSMWQLMPAHTPYLMQKPGLLRPSSIIWLVLGLLAAFMLAAASVIVPDGDIRALLVFLCGVGQTIMLFFYWLKSSHPRE